MKNESQERDNLMGTGNELVEDSSPNVGSVKFFLIEGSPEADSSRLIDSSELSSPVKSELLNAFKASAIHEKCYWKFWEEELEAGPWIMNIIKSGYRPFSQEPTEYFERNNCTVRDNMSIVKNIVTDMIAMNVVEVVKEKPWCVSSLVLVSKVKEDGSMKHKLVSDGSRHVNGFIQELPVKLNHLEKALEMTVLMVLKEFEQQQRDNTCFFKL